MDVILTVAYGKVCDYPTYRAFLNSFQAIGRPDLKLVIVGGNMSRSARVATQSSGAELLESSARLNDPGNKQRHWDFAEYLCRNQHSIRHVLTVDSRDTILQSDPFTFAAFDAGVRVLFSAESVLIKDDPWNQQDQTAFHRSIRRACRRESFRNWPVINGGFVAGSATAIADFQLTRFAVDAREGDGTDQGSLAALANWTRDWPGYQIVGDNQPWVFHGHWLAKCERAAVRDDGFVVVRSTGEPYRAFHQWDRTASLEPLLRRFG